ncbi:MAG: LPS export ABC transporter permease LptF [Deltaproteobacteria bacterium]|nr:LPS export ABC transporter permease LptF [Deltaproteobacteria bacterium]
MALRLIRRYVAREILVPFGLGLFILTFVIMMFQILKVTDLMVNYGLRLADVLRVFMYLLPPFTVFTIPMAFLLGVMLAVGRLSSDSEIVAMKASGVSLVQLLPPVMVLAAAAYVFSSALSLYADPWGKLQSKRMLERVGTQFAGALLKEKVFNTDINNLVIYIEEIDPATKDLSGIFISDESQPDLPIVITAARGKITHSPSGGKVAFQLEDGAIHRTLADASIYDAAHFERNEIVYDIRKGLAGEAGKKSYLEMTLPELSAYIDGLRVDLRAGGLDDGAKKDKTREMRRAWVEYHRKFSFPFACVVFGILGLPLGVVAPRSGRGQGFTMAIVVLCAYYLLFRVGENLGWKGVVHPFFAMWAPNLLYLVAGAYLVWSRTRERPVWVIEKLGAASTRVVEIARRRVAGRGPGEGAS